MTQCDYDNRVEGETRVGNWMQTVTGRRFFPLDPRPEEVFIEDIAHALGMACRFGGHCQQFYSVAEHSVHVSYLVPEEDAFAGLMHDAAEAYVADIIRPIKPYLDGYAAIEERVWFAIADRFGIARELPASVKVADNAMLLSEAAHIMAQPPELWKVPGEPAHRRPQCWTPPRATAMFIARFNRLSGQPVSA